MVDYYTTPNQLVTKIKTLYSDLTDKDFDQMNVVALYLLQK
jgi:hypothetical protein